MHILAKASTYLVAYRDVPSLRMTVQSEEGSPFLLRSTTAVPFLEIQTDNFEVSQETRTKRITFVTSCLANQSYLHYPSSSKLSIQAINNGKKQERL